MNWDIVSRCLPSKDALFACPRFPRSVEGRLRAIQRAGPDGNGGGVTGAGLGVGAAAGRGGVAESL